MNQNNIKQKSIFGVLWSLVENFSIKIIQFIINIIMARLLMPDDYGLISMVYVFILISQVFIDGGFATALIQDKNKTERDYSTIYTFNIVISLLCYIVIYVSSPLISDFYNTDITLPLRILSLNLIVAALSAIHKVKLTVDVNFKQIAKVNIISASLSGTTGIIMAYNGFGLWSLITQYISNSVISTLLLLLIVKWEPICFFDRLSFKRLYPFGIKLMISNLIDRIYQNLYTIFVGKFFSATDLGYYSRAEQFALLPAGTCADVFLRVTFPVMSSINEKDKLVSVYRKYIALSSFVIIPILLLVILLAKQIVLLLLTEKWSTIIPLLQILTLGFIFDHVSAINRNLLYVKGRADLALKLEVVKKIIATFILIASIPYGLIGLCIGKAFYGIIAVILNSYYTKSLINVSFREQVKDFGPIFIVGVLSMILSYIIIENMNNHWVILFVGVIVFAILYILLSYIFRIKSLNYVYKLCIEAINKLRKK